MSIETQDTEGYLEATQEDLNLYFSDTYLKLRDRRNKGESAFCYIREFGNSEDGPIVYYSDTDRGRLQESRLQDMDFDFQFPQIGMYNFQKTVLFFQRTTARQNKKGLCKGTALLQAVHDFVGDFEPGVPYDFRLRNQWKWSTGNVTKTFGKLEYLSVAEGFDAVRKCKAFARALSKNFFVAPGVRGVNPSLWFRRTLVGEVVSPDRIQVTAPLFNQEVIDELSGKGVRINAA